MSSSTFIASKFTSISDGKSNQEHTLDGQPVHVFEKPLDIINYFGVVLVVDYIPGTNALLEKYHEGRSSKSKDGGTGESVGTSGYYDDYNRKPEPERDDPFFVELVLKQLEEIRDEYNKLTGETITLTEITNEFQVNENLETVKTRLNYCGYRVEWVHINCVNKWEIKFPEQGCCYQSYCEDLIVKPYTKVLDCKMAEMLYGEEDLTPEEIVAKLRAIFPPLPTQTRAQMAKVLYSPESRVAQSIIERCRESV